MTLLQTRTKLGHRPRLQSRSSFPLRRNEAPIKTGACWGEGCWGFKEEESYACVCTAVTAEPISQTVRFPL